METTIGHETSEHLSHALGEAAVRMWSRLPHDIQQHLFEEVIASRGNRSGRSSPSFCTNSMREPRPQSKRERSPNRTAWAAKEISLKVKPAAFSSTRPGER